MSTGKKINIPKLGNVYYSNLVNTSVLGGTSGPVPVMTNTGSSNSSSHLSNLNNILLHSSGNVYHAPKPPNVFSPTTILPPPPLLVNPVPVFAIPPTPIATTSDSGGLGSGGGGGSSDSSTDDSGVSQRADVTTPIASTHLVAIASFSLLAVAGGATAGYFLGKHFKKSPLLFSVIGGIAFGLATFGITKYVVYKPQSISGFAGFGSKPANNKYALTVKCKDDMGATTYHKGGCPSGTTGVAQ